MLIKKPGILLTSYNALSVHSSPQSHHKSTTSPSSPPVQRNYATTRDLPRQSHNETKKKQKNRQEEIDLWPRTTSNSLPTPYQILSCQKGAPYKKTERFYALVKLYHPDLPPPSDTPAVDHAVRLERYRLVIAAHTLLSDSTKRSAYDMYGAGWQGGNVLPDFTYNPAARKAAMSNATWEDWEQWYAKFRGPDDPPPAPQKTLYTSNSKFISIIAILAALGGVGQATRADGESKSFIAQRDAAHLRAMGELRDGKMRSEGWSRQERIEAFLRNRDPAAWDDEGVRRMLLDPDICESGVAIKDEKEDVRRKFE